MGGGGDICFCFKNKLLILDCLYVSSSYFLMFVLIVYNKNLSVKSVPRPLFHKSHRTEQNLSAPGT